MTDTETPPKGSGQGTTDAKWFGSLNLPPEDVGYIQNKGWVDSPVKMFESYKNLEKLHGVGPEQLLKLPKQEDVEGWGKVYDRLGRPAKPEEYGEIKPPEGKTWVLDEERIKQADLAMHKAGLNKAQRDAIISSVAEYETTQFVNYGKEVVEKSEVELSALKQEGGAGFEERSTLAKRAVRTFLPGDNEDAKNALLDKIEASVGTSTMLKMFANIGERMMEDKSPMGDTKENRFGYTKEQAMADKKILEQELFADIKRLDTYNKGGGADYDKMQRLIKIIASK